HFHPGAVAEAALAGGDHDVAIGYAGEDLDVLAVFVAGFDDLAEGHVVSHEVHGGFVVFGGDGGFGDEQRLAAGVVDDADASEHAGLEAARAVAHFHGHLKRARRRIHHG